MMNTGIKINNDLMPQSPNPKKTEESNVMIQPTNLNNVMITITGIFPTLINSIALEKNEGSPASASIPSETSTSETSPKPSKSISVSIPLPDKKVNTDIDF